MTNARSVVMDHRNLWKTPRQGRSKALTCLDDRDLRRGYPTSQQCSRKHPGAGAEFDHRSTGFRQPSRYGICKPRA